MFYVQNSGCFMQKIPFKGDAHKRKWVVIIFKICNYMAFKKKKTTRCPSVSENS